MNKTKFNMTDKFLNLIRFSSNIANINPSSFKSICNFSVTRNSSNFACITYVELTFNLLECGSVHIKQASTNFTRFNPFNFFKHSDKSSLDSRAA